MINHHHPGDQFIWQGVAIELLYEKSRTKKGGVWRAKPLFVEGPRRDVTILADDQWVSLHCQFPGQECGKSVGKV